jgi:6-methylsalicylate decarboxylase
MQHETIGPRLSPTRRNILSFTAAMTAGATLGRNSAAAQAKPTRTDVHHHFFPPAFLEARRNALTRQNRPAAFGAADSWSVGKAIEAMDLNHIATAILSISTPGPWFGNAEESIRLARQCNEYATEMIRDHPGRFGLFAALPLPDTDAALREIDYAFDTLKADGVGMMTTYATTAGVKWPGDPSFTPLFAELNRRRAVVLVHLGRVGASQTCCGNVVPGVPDAMAETPHELTRAVLSLLLTGTLSRNPDIRFIFIDGGGTMPILAEYVAVISKRMGSEFERLVPNGAEYELSKLYYEVSNVATPKSLAALAAFVPATQILFGTDFPFELIATTAGGVDGFWAEPLRDAIYRTNAARLFPRLGRA